MYGSASAIEPVRIWIVAIPIRPNVLRMRPYSPGKPISEVRRELGLENIVKLASNENPLGPSPKAVLAAQAAAKDLNVYPDGAAFELKTALSHKFGVPAEQVVLGNGSDDLIDVLARVLLGSPQDEVIMGEPSFVRYESAAEIADSVLKKIPHNSRLEHDLSVMAAAITGRTKIVFIANPCNPTGTIVRRKELDAFVRDLPPQAVLILDEAYYEFAVSDPDYPVSLDYLKAGSNVVGLRTFSKAYGLAGVRMGYGFAPEPLADAVLRARQPFGVNSVAQAACLAAIDDTEHVEKTVRVTQDGVIKLTKQLESLGAKVVPTHANFLYADFGVPTVPIFQRLLKAGYIVRTGDIFGDPTFLRISIGTPEEMDGFCAALKDAVIEKVAR